MRRSSFYEHSRDLFRCCMLAALSASLHCGTGEISINDAEGSGGKRNAPSTGGGGSSDKQSGTSGGGGSGADDRGASHPQGGDDTGGGNAPGEVGTDTKGAGGSAGMGSANSDVSAGALAHGVSITEVALYQGVKVSLSKEGKPTDTLNAPIVDKRPGLVRVSVKRAPSFSARDIVARLSWGPSGQTVDKDVSITVGADSSDATLGSTFNFPLTDQQITGDLNFAVELHEASGSNVSGDVQGARYPESGFASLTTESSGDGIHITFVPIQYGADKSNRLPDTSDAQLKFLTDKMFATYPVSKVFTSVHAPVPYAGAIGPTTGWSSALSNICSMRQNEKPKANEYYFAMVAPGDTVEQYCKSSCIMGVAVQSTGPNDRIGKCSMGVGYASKGSGVFLQEVAHTLGRKHAPCGNVASPDGMYPYMGAKIGVWGYDLTADKLYDPTKLVDFMSYCNPVWISDYTYKALFDRIQTVNRQVTPYIQGERSSPPLYRAIAVEPDGTASTLDEVPLDDPAEERRVEVRLAGSPGASSAGASSAQGYFYPDSLGGGTLYLPASASPASSLEWGGRRATLGSR